MFSSPSSTTSRKGSTAWLSRYLCCITGSFVCPSTVANPPPLNGELHEVDYSDQQMHVLIDILYMDCLWASYIRTRACNLLVGRYMCIKRNCSPKAHCVHLHNYLIYSMWRGLIPCTFTLIIIDTYYIHHTLVDLLLTFQRTFHAHIWLFLSQCYRMFSSVS